MLPAAVIAVGLLLGACGDDDEEGASPSSVVTEASEYQFDPESWTVPAGETFSVEFQNVGDLEHEWVVIDLGEDIESESEFREDLALLEVEAPGGESATGEFTIDEAGTYQVVCAISGHFDAGMEGSLVVE
jgi:uncharacterized cupredoxin-like copper-binding protein